jgi:hypothetical protein
MKTLICIFVLLEFASCRSLKLSVPDVFKEQATEYHISGSRKNKMSFGVYSTSKIRRGPHVSYPGWSRGFILENLLLNQAGLQKLEHIVKEKAKSRYTLSDGHNYTEIFGQENEMTRSHEYKILDSKSIFNKYERPQEYRYIFSAVIKTDEQANGNNWELVMSNIYERKKDTINSLFTIIRPDDRGFATNGADSIFIKPVSLKNTEAPGGQKGNLPIKLLSGYELSNQDGVIAIIDLIDSNVWLYNELNDKERLVIAAITTALFTRKVNDTKW